MEIKKSCEGRVLFVEVANSKVIYLDHPTLRDELLSRFKDVLREADEARLDMGGCMYSHDFKEELWEFETLLDGVLGDETPTARPPD